MNNTTSRKRVARVFGDVGGYRFCCDTLPYDDARGIAWNSVRDLLRSLRQHAQHAPEPYTHYRRGGRPARKLGVAS